MTDEINPYAASTLGEDSLRAVPQLQGRPWMLNAAVLLATLILIGYPIASAFAWAEIESIVFSGAALFIAGAIVLVLSIYCRLFALRVFAITTIAVVLGVFFTIFINQWSPGDAAKPISRASVVIAVVMQWGWLAIRQARLHRNFDPSTVSGQDLDSDRSTGQPTIDTGS